MNSLLDQLYATLVLGKEKALAGAVVAFAAAFLLQHVGYHVSDSLQQAVTALVVAGITHAAVYFKSTNIK